MEQVTKEIAIKVRDIVSCGLSSGLGNQVPGEMCIEAAVCFAYGLPHGDNPPCVGRSVRAFKIKLNDSNWNSNLTRAEGMKKIAIAQLGSESIDQVEFSERITIKIINSIIADLAHKYLPEVEEEMRTSSDLAILNKLCIKLRIAAYAAYAAAAAAADAAYAAAAYAAAAAAADAANAANAAYAAAAAAAADAADAANKDIILTKAADLCLEVLKELKSPGCEFLYLLN